MVIKSSVKILRKFGNAKLFTNHLLSTADLADDADLILFLKDSEFIYRKFKVETVHHAGSNKTGD